MLAEELVGEARVRRARGMDARERVVTLVSAAAFVVAAVAIAIVVPDERSPSLALTLGLVVGYAVILHIRFEFGGYFGSPEHLAFIPLLFLGPLPYIPLLVAAAGFLSLLPDVVRGEWHRDSWAGSLADSWAHVGGVLVLAALAPGKLEAGLVDVYALAVTAHFATDLAWTLVRNQLLDRLPLPEVLKGFAGTARVDAILTPIAFAVSLVAVDHPLYLLSMVPLVWLFELFAIDRRERYSKTLELHRAYRGTVMLLSDVVESEDSYTAAHSRSVVELVNAVADELDFPTERRQELEFAAMLHDVGKIAIPKEILNKPSRLTESEFELMKTHTIEGQFMLDRVGGLLGRVGEIVRSCHERWDGKGYPDGLAGQEIPLAARIVFVCDAYNAMTTDRAYRAAKSPQEALVELVTHAGTQFDPRVVAAVTTVIDRGEPVLTATDEVRALLAGSPAQTKLGAGSGA